MLSTNKLRSIYSKIQTELFYMIPEKWDKICLYASVIERFNHLQTGEMFFYYYPTGILKKNPVNVYEIPNRFNINEKEYMKLVDKLYATIKELREVFKQSKEEKMWTNLTITIENFKFNVEYAYEDLTASKYTSYDRHIIWKCKNLNLPLERLTKKDRKMVEEYFLEQEIEKQKTKLYTEGMYQKKVHNIIEYENTDKYIIQNQEDEQIENHIEQLKEEKQKIDKYEQYKQEQEEKKQKEKQEKEDVKNQILKI